MNFESKLFAVIDIVFFYLRLIKHGIFFKDRFIYSKRNSGTLVVLANGPSLKEVLPRISDTGDFEGVEYSVHNFFAFTQDFFKIKPKYYALADPMFIYKNHRYKEVVKLFEILQNKVDWNLYLYIPFGIKQFVEFSKITNKCITIVQINNTEVKCGKKLLHYFYSKGLTCPFLCTVAQLNIFCGINDGFDEIHLYGVDHTMICNLYVNNKNELCNIVEHFYEESEKQYTPIKKSDGKVFSVSEFLTFNGRLFKSHEQLNDYAAFHNSRIINYTPKSMIDCYERNKDTFRIL